jgi:hydroxymethylpyrimidine kinase/phosphomethylpyrimidine kinase/thiamine-phosphate diphosphorylase
VVQENLEDEIVKSIQAARRFDARLFINDYWRLAMKHKAYGVHLGQGDLIFADIEAIAGSGLRLGISTHGYSEVARALALRPSYIAIGPIHETNTKEVGCAPQGVDALKRWRRTLRYPLVAIGGISLNNAQEVLDAGADGAAVIKDVTKAPDGDSQVRAWLKLFGKHKSMIGLTGARTGLT